MLGDTNFGINDLEKVETNINKRTSVLGDYSYDKAHFQIRTYKAGDRNKSEGHKQNIQIDKNMAKNLIEYLTIFVEQK